MLWFEQEWEDGDDTELLIGVYRTEADALAAKDRLLPNRRQSDRNLRFIAALHLPTLSS